MLSARAQQGQDVGLRGRDERHDNNQRRQHTSELYRDHDVRGLDDGDGLIADVEAKIVDCLVGD